MSKLKELTKRALTGESHLMPGKWKKEDCKIEASLSYIARL
jgi:hypothetical protein